MNRSKKLQLPIHTEESIPLMMSIVLELECPVLGCKEVPGGAKWKTPLLLYEQAHHELDLHLLYNHPFGTMNKLVPKVSVGDNDPKIGEVMQLFNVSGLSQRQPDHSSAALQLNKTARRKKRTRKYQNLRKVRTGKFTEENPQMKLRKEKLQDDTSRYEVITDIKELESSVAIYPQLEANRRCPLPDSGELQRGDCGPEQGALYLPRAVSSQHIEPHSL